MKIAIVGLGGSYADYISARVASQEFDEIWGINCIGGIIHVDRTFMMDPVSRFIDTENAGYQPGIAREFLAKEGYDQAYGARPIKRAIQRYVEDVVADSILDGLLKEGKSYTISKDGKLDKLKIK